MKIFNLLILLFLVVSCSNSDDSKEQQDIPPGESSVFFKGMLWGLIPCGLLYGMLVIAATTADVFRGASFMLFFGLGTVLPLLFSQLVMRRLMAGSKGTWLRSISGTFIIVLGLWIMLSPWFAHGLIPEDNVFFTELSAVLALCIP